ncbi:DinB family protein [Paenibacillus sp. RC67]|uniref:DinB family protein n=1 Tax=Paenibacillus sp. RC67 TaxID=3039392 RepID=UPI0024AD6316|nr:DinB family protein [Paenibacillus sp. RC67]
MTLSLLDQELEKIEKALNRISDENVWEKLKEGTNSIGNLCLHLAGNEYHNIVSSIGGQPFTRERSAEFLAEGGYSCKELYSCLSNVREQSRSILTALSEEELEREVTIHYPPDAGIATYQRPVARLLYHLTVHYAYHTGQIVYMTRLLQDRNDNILKWKH